MKATVWQDPTLTHTFLTGVRGALPLAHEQVEVMMRLIEAACPAGIQTFLDLGCGDGILGQAIYDVYPAGTGIFLDFSEPMLEAAHRRFADKLQSVFMSTDYGDPRWVAEVNGYAPFDVIVSGYSIHHQTDERKKAIYGEIYELLRPGGIFINVEHVAVCSAWVGSVFHRLFVDKLYAYQQSLGSSKTWEEVDRAYVSRPDKAANILALPEEQCDWLRDIGYVDVDCYLRLFEFAVFGGRKRVEGRG